MMKRHFDLDRPGSRGALAWAMAEAGVARWEGTRVEGRRGDSAAPFEDRRGEDSYGAAPYEIGDDLAELRWRELATRDELLINIYETRSAEPIVLLSAIDSPCLVAHRHTRAFAIWWLAALGRWSLEAGASVCVDGRLDAACRGAALVDRLVELVPRAVNRSLRESLERLPPWTTSHVVAGPTTAAGAVLTLAGAAKARDARVYVVVSVDDLLCTSRRVQRADGRVVVLSRPASTVTRAAVDDAVELGRVNGVRVSPVVIGDAPADYRRAVRRVGNGGLR